MIPLKIEASFYDANSSRQLEKTFTIYISNLDEVNENDLGLIQDTYLDDILQKTENYLVKKGYDAEDLEYEIYLVED